MKISLTITTTPNGDVTRNICVSLKQMVDVVVNEVMRDYRNDDDIVLVSGNPSRVSFHNYYGEHVAIKVTK